jgi:hypothetical protein
MRRFILATGAAVLLTVASVGSVAALGKGPAHSVPVAGPGANPAASGGLSILSVVGDSTVSSVNTAVQSIARNVKS